MAFHIIHAQGDALVCVVPFVILLALGAATQLVLYDLKVKAAPWWHGPLMVTQSTLRAEEPGAHQGHQLQGGSAEVSHMMRG